MGSLGHSDGLPFKCFRLYWPVLIWSLMIRGSDPEKSDTVPEYSSPSEIILCLSTSHGHGNSDEEKLGSSLTCIYWCWVVFWIVRAVSLAGELFHNFINTLIVSCIVSTSRIIGVCSTHKKRITVSLSENSYVVVAVINTFPLDETKLSISCSWVPGYPKVCIFTKVRQTDVVNNISGPDK